MWNLEMELPETNTLNFFNKVLILLSELTSRGDSCAIETLIKQCKSISFGGTFGDYELIISQCRHSGLVSIKNTDIVLSTLGHKFLSANRERYFEISEAQKQIIVERVVFKGAWSPHARELFEHFSVNQLTATYELSTIDISLTKKLNSTVHFLKFLGVLYSEEFLIKVEKRYAHLIYELTADSKALSEQQLEKILFENRKLGAQAEIAVVEFERQRLKKLGKFAQAALVKRISVMNTGAGYDVESFDGTGDEIFPNRFIEVKATTGHQIRFYWTINEKEVAKKKKDRYWIYMMLEFREDKPHESLPIMIQNPEYSIPKNNYLTMEGHTFLIKEIAQVELSEHSLQEVKWYHLE